MVVRGILVVILSVAVFVIMFLTTGLTTLLLTGNSERAMLIGGVCGFAAAWATNTTYIIIEQRTGREVSDGKDKPGDDTDRR